MQLKALSAGKASLFPIFIAALLAVFPEIVVAADSNLSLDNSTATQWVQFAKDIWRWVSTIAVLAGMSIAIIAYLLGADAKWLKYCGVIIFFGAAGLAISEFIFEVTGADSMLNEGGQ